MQDITINWRSTSKSAQVNKQVRIVMEKLQNTSEVRDESVLDLIKKDAVRLAAALPENSREASRILKANAAAIEALYARCANVSQDAASTMTAIMNEALAGKHTVAVIDARSKNAPAIAWKNNVACFMVIDPSYLHTDGKGGFLALSTAC